MLQRHRILQGDGQAQDLGGEGPLNVWKKANRKLANSEEEWEKFGYLEQLSTDVMSSEKGGL